MSQDSTSAPHGDERAGAAALAALRSELVTPPRLRARIEAARAQRRAPRWRLPALAGAGAAAMTAVVIALLLAGSDPTVGDAAEIAGRTPDAPAPAVADDRAVLAGSFEGLAHPNWKPEFGWRAVGERDDELDGRSTRTVFYAKEGERLAYTIVSGEALEAPRDGRTEVVDGVEFTTYRTDDRKAVTWLRGGHTCVLVGSRAGDEDLVELAAWKGDGAVAF